MIRLGLVLVALGILLWAYRAIFILVSRRRERHMALAARADQQNEWYLAGDSRGIYGGEPDPDPPLSTPPPLHDIPADGPKPPPVRPPTEFDSVYRHVTPIAGRRNPLTGEEETIYRVYGRPDLSWIEFGRGFK